MTDNDILEHFCEANQEILNLKASLAKKSENVGYCSWIALLVLKLCLLLKKTKFELLLAQLTLTHHHEMSGEFSLPKTQLTMWVEQRCPLSNFKIQLCVLHFAFKMSVSALFKEHGGEKSQHF